MKLRWVPLVAVFVAAWADDESRAADPPSSEAVAELERVASDARALREPLEETFQAGRREAWKCQQRLRAAQAAEARAREQLAAATKTDGDVTLFTTAVERAVANTSAAEAELHASTAKAAQIGERLEVATADHVSKLRAAQEALTKVGRFVSFAREIAPLFAERCLSCHSARVAKGRVDLENYAAVLRGGKKGKIVEHGDAESSPLYRAVADGLMPEEGELLSEDEITLVGRWIELGAPLDAGVDPQAALVSVLPRRAPPSPPQTYRTSIPVTALDFSVDGEFLASSGYHEVLVWRVSDGKLVKRITDVPQRTYAIDFSPDGETLVVASGTPGGVGEVTRFRVDDGALVRRFLMSAQPVYAARFSPDGERLATGGADRIIRVYQVADGRELFRIGDHFDSVMDLAWSPNGRRLASASLDKNAKVFDMETGFQTAVYQKSYEVNFTGRILSVAFTSDSQRIVSCGDDEKVRLWNAADAELVRAIEDFDGSVLRVAALSDGNVVSSSADRTVRLHRLADGKELRVIARHRDWVYALTVHEASGRVASGSYDGQIRVGRLDGGGETLSFVAKP